MRPEKAVTDDVAAFFYEFYKDLYEEIVMLSTRWCSSPDWGVHGDGSIPSGVMITVADRG